MTTYPIAAFWELAERCGLAPETVRLVPRNTLDRHYAYFFCPSPTRCDRSDLAYCTVWTV
jgi:hypothetical protein